MFAHAEGVDAGLIGQLDFLDEVLETFGAGWLGACLRVGNCGREAIDANLHGSASFNR